MTIIYPSPIFGPVHSRRLGVSLGVNLLPSDGKICSFDCLYCECGLNQERRTKSKFPARELVYATLEAKLKEMVENNNLPDVITFAGNGEPTGHPDFFNIIKDTLLLRNQFAPKAKVSVLSNAAHLNREQVIEALKLVDNNILKLDTVDTHFINTVDRPNFDYNIQQIIENIKKFEGKCIIQTMFLKGNYEGEVLNNTTDKYVLPWLDVIDEIKPREVMIYTIDRETPIKTLEKASKEDLDKIGEMVKNRHHKVQISY